MDLHRCMARKKLIPTKSIDLRDLPSYSIEEAARYLHMPKQTLARWVGAGLVPIADAKASLLSFYDLAEAHVLLFAQKQNVPLSRARATRDYVREKVLSTGHPLLDSKAAVHGGSLILDGLRNTHGNPVDAGRYGQIAIGRVIRRYLSRIERDKDGLPVALAPIFKKRTQAVVINPYISSGRPVLRESGVLISILHNRHKYGRERVGSLARDYGISRRSVETAIQYYATR